MNQRKARADRQATVVEPNLQPHFWTSWKGVLVGLGVAVVIGASFVVPRVTGNESPTASHSTMPGSAGDGPTIGSTPGFQERDVVTGQPISSQTVRGRKTLLFFSEGVMCQACLQQIRDIDDVGDMMASRNIRLVSITPDSRGDLKQAIRQYGITSPMISDGDRNMSETFNMLGKGMHADMPGHAFVLIDGSGKVLWQRDYYQPPYRTMYVNPDELFKDIPS